MNTYVAVVKDTCAKSVYVKGSREEMEKCFDASFLWERSDYEVPLGYFPPITEEEYEEARLENPTMLPISELPNILEKLERLSDIDGETIGYVDCWGVGRTLGNSDNADDSNELDFNNFYDSWN